MTPAIHPNRLVQGIELIRPVDGLGNRDGRSADSYISSIPPSSLFLVLSSDIVNGPSRGYDSE